MTYIDNLIIFSNSYEQDLERMRLVLNKLRENDLKLSPKKCKFFQPEVKYVGHIVSADGIKPDPDKIWPPLNYSDQVRQFLGFAGYYRKYVNNISRMARPLTDLLPPTYKKKEKRNKQKIFIMVLGSRTTISI